MLYERIIATQDSHFVENQRKTIFQEYENFVTCTLVRKKTHDRNAHISFPNSYFFIKSREFPGSGVAKSSTTKS